MGLRFGKRIKLAPGIRLNVGLKGASLSLGPRGANVNIARKGVYGNVGLPGTGLSYRTRLDAPKRPKPAAPPVDPLPRGVRIDIGSNGVAALSDPAGHGFSPEVEALARRRFSAEIKAALEARAGAANSGLKRLTHLHLDTPQPLLGAASPPRGRTPPPLDEPGTSAAERARREEEWLVYRHANASPEQSTPGLAEHALALAVLEDRLAAVSWPRETLLDLDLSADGAVVRADVGLPEIEDMPDRVMKPDARAGAVVLAPMPGAARQGLYSQHVHGIIFRVAGEIFSASPSAMTAVISGYTQRQGSKGARDVYILSVAIERGRWITLLAQPLESIDPVIALADFPLRRTLSQRGALGAVTPFE